MNTRDDAENVLRLWNTYETSRNSPAVVDFDCHPQPTTGKPITSRLDALTRLTKLRDQAADEGDPALQRRLDADCAYAEALLGVRAPLSEYIERTQGCGAAGWSDNYISHYTDILRKSLADIGISWGKSTADDLSRLEGTLAPGAVADEILSATAEYEPRIRELAGTTATFNLEVETVDVDEYWLCWLDGSGHDVRLRINTHHGKPVSRVRARQLALHEVLGHGLQSASFASHADTASWVRILAVHAPCQVLLEGLAQAMPLFIAPDDAEMGLRVKFAHHSHLIRSRAHLALEQGVPIWDIAGQIRYDAPFFTDAQISDLLTDRGTKPLLRTYMWAYTAGIDWFMHAADAEPAIRSSILRSAYKEPLSPTQLSALWPAGPTIGG